MFAATDGPATPKACKPSPSYSDARFYLRSRFFVSAPFFPTGVVAALMRSFIGALLGFPFGSCCVGVDCLTDIRFLLRKQNNNSYVGNDKRGYR